MNSNTHLHKGDVLKISHETQFTSEYEYLDEDDTHYFLRRRYDGKEICIRKSNIVTLEPKHGERIDYE
jgi:hypothetical protein